jgi:CRISPR-associated protein Csm2
MSVLNSKIVFGASLPENLFSEIAKEKAVEVYQSGLDQRGNQAKNKSTQLRKFYDELVMWCDKVHNTGRLEPGQKGADIRQVRYVESAPFIKMLIAKVAYAKGRNHVDDCFDAMFSHCISSVTDATSLKHAKLFMEAFMGFYKAQE